MSVPSGKRNLGLRFHIDGTKMVYLSGDKAPGPASGPEIELYAKAQELAGEVTQLRQALEVIIDQAVHRWHTVAKDEPSLAAWLGLSDEQYRAWVAHGAALVASRPG